MGDAWDEFWHAVWYENGWEYLTVTNVMMAAIAVAGFVLGWVSGRWEDKRYDRRHARAEKEEAQR